MKIIYVVHGSSESLEWIIKAFVSKTRAIEWANKAKKRSEELGLDLKYPYYWQIPDGANEYDPGMKMYPGGVDYNVLEIELNEEE
jgi:hypothetical protein